MTDYSAMPFDEAIEFFRKKLNLPTKRWDDIRKAAHDDSFTVAGATKADLLQELRDAVDKGISQGTGIEEFRSDFKKLVEKNGWTGWRGEGTKEGVAWRTKVIYDTNLATAYAAGRYQQMKETARLRPLWRYRHSRAAMRPREQHLAWDRLTLRHDDPWWEAHYPPNGWNCFPSGTPVMTPQGWRPIESIRVGDVVVSGSGKPQSVVRTYANPFDGQIVRVATEKAQVAATPNHPFLTIRGWVDARDLQIGDGLLSHDDSLSESHAVIGIHRESFSASVFNLSVANDFTYIVPTGVVHNCGCYVETLSVREAGPRGADKSPPIQYREHAWPDGTKEKIPKGVDPGFNYRPGASRDDEMKRNLRSKTGNWVIRLIMQFIAELMAKWLP